MKNGGRLSADDRDAIAKAYVEDGFEAACALFPANRRLTIRGVLVKQGLCKPGRVDWKTHDVELFRFLWPTQTAKELGLRFGRTERAIYQLAHALKLRPKRPPKWTAGQDRIVQQEFDALVDRLAMRFGRSKGAVVQRLSIVRFGYRKRNRRSEITDLGGVPGAVAQPERKVS
jgi:hypothetical protein